MAKPIQGIPTMTLANVGYGAGKRKQPRPNLLRVLLGS
ncbi:MAG TPA: nickel insertion protein [Verrucomicrobiae bacterium]|nr:nickel insertion protein [Verrucomicrobiae bacterium]